MENEEILSDDVAAKSPKLIDENKLSKSGTSVVADGALISCIGDTNDGYPDIFSKITKQKKKPIAMPSGKDDFFYNMNFRNRGLAVIFNHETFDIPSLKARNGTEADCRNLSDVLTKLDFDVRKYLNLTAQQIDSVTNEIAREIVHWDHDCFLMAILSHGEHGIIYAKDVAYKFDVLMDKFTPDKCPSLAGKPKLFLIQACQGDRLDGGIDLERVQVDSEIGGYRIPLYADFLVAYSTIPGFYSWRNTERGSWFIQAFCQELSVYGSDYDLLTLLTFVNRRVAVDFESNVPNDKTMHRQKQISCITSMLTRLVKFTPKNTIIDNNNAGRRPKT